MSHEVFDSDMKRHFRYHNKLVKLCRTIAAIHVDSALFDRLAPHLSGIKDNQQIRWLLEDELRDLLWQNGDFKEHKGGTLKLRAKGPRS
jgi:hypothetical protein